MVVAAAVPVGGLSTDASAIARKAPALAVVRSIGPGDDR